MKTTRVLLGTTSSNASYDRGMLMSAIVGALLISNSATFVQEAGASATDTAFFRCFLALPVLAILARREFVSAGRPSYSVRAAWMARLAGVAFGLDLVAWTHCIHDVGAGLATVLGNLQIVFVVFFSWALLKQQPNRTSLQAVGVMMVGVLLVSDIGGHGGAGNDPRAGVAYGLCTSALYATFLLCMRSSSRRLTTALPGRSLFEATIGATLAVAIASPLCGAITLPSTRSLTWLAVLALVSQVGGWLLISRALPNLSALTTSAVLLVQPAAALVVAYVALNERPSVLQLSGAALIVVGMLWMTARRDRGGTTGRSGKSGERADSTLPALSHRQFGALLVPIRTRSRIRPTGRKA